MQILDSEMYSHISWAFSCHPTKEGDRHPLKGSKRLMEEFFKMGVEHLFLSVWSHEAIMMDQSPGEDERVRYSRVQEKAGGEKMEISRYETKD